MKKILVLIVLAFTFIHTQAQLPDNWTGDTDIDLFQESATVHGGSYSCGIIVNSGDQANCDMDNGVEIAVSAGDDFKLNFWAYTSQNVRARAVFNWVGASRTYSDNYVGPGTPGWELFEFAEIVPAGATGLTIGIRFYDVAGFTPPETQYVDDVTFESPIGDPLTVVNGDFESWPGINPEPTNYPTDFIATASGLNIMLSWLDATGTVLPEAYLIKASQTSNITLPVDGVSVADDLDLSDGTGTANVVFGTQMASFTGCAALATYYFRIFPYNNTGVNIDYKNDGTPPAAEATTSSFVVIASENFDAGWGGYTQYNVTGDQVWNRDNTYGISGTPCAQMAGYSGGAVENEDWLISPALDLTDFSNEVVSFYSAYNYDGDALEFKVSTDYDGSGDPNAFSWTDLSDQVIWSAGNFVWTESGAIDISAYSDGMLYIAFVYFSDDVSASTWEIDDVTVTGEGEFNPEPEPTNYPEAFAATASGQNIMLTWTDATGDVVPAGYLIKVKTDDNISLPEDFMPVPDDTDLSDGEGAKNVMAGAEAYTFTGLDGNTTYYFMIFPYSNSGVYIDYKTDGTPPAANASTESTTVILFTDFNESWGGWTPVSLVGDQVWDRNNTYGLEGSPCAKMAGFSGTPIENVDWLISPPINFDNYDSEVLSFYTALGYGTAEPQFSARISIDYDGGGDPNTASWTELNPILPPDGSYFEWTSSGNLDVSGFDGEQVYIAFVYESTTEEAATWEVDNVELVGEGEYIPTPEPTNYPASFTAEANALSIELNWTDATGAVVPTGYLIKASAEDNIMVPDDFVPVDNDPDLSDGTGAMNVAEGVESYTFSGLLENTAYYFKIFPYTNTGEYIDYKTDGTVPSATATTTEDNTVDIMFTTFDESWEEWTAINITGDQVWDRNNTFGIDGTPCAKMSGYEGTTFENEDWLISPMLDLSDYKNEKISFFNAYSYNGIALEFKISMDYDGGGSPKDFTWTNLTGEVIWSGGFFSWTESGEVDISSYADDIVYVAFVFQCTATESSTWEIDNILLKGEEDTGIEENIEENTFMIYPNPNNGAFTLVNIANFDRIEIYSVTGSQVFRGRVNSENMQFAIPELNKGIYYIRLIDEQKNTIFSKPLIIQ